MTAVTTSRRSWFPFNAEQMLNILSEIGPVFTMFIVNFLYGVEAGVISLIVTTVLALITSLIMFRRPPVMPFIAGAVTITFGLLTFVTGDPMWVQIKVTIFNALVGVLLLVGLYRRKYFFEFVFGKTFSYTEQGWRQLTRNVGVFFLVTAIANEAVRLGFASAEIATPEHFMWLLKKPQLNGLDIWMIFKLFIVMPLTSLYFVWQVQLMQKFRLPETVKGPAAPSAR